MIPNTNLPTAKTTWKPTTTLNPLLRCHSLWWIGSKHLVSCISFCSNVNGPIFSFCAEWFFCASGWGTGKYTYICIYIHKNLNHRGNNIHTLLINHANISNPEWPHEIIQYLDLHFSTKHSFGSDFLQLMFFFGGRLNIWKPLSP